MIPATSYRAAAFLAAAASLAVDLIVVTDADLALVGPGDTALVVEDLSQRTSVLAAGAKLRAIDAVVGVDDAALPAAAWLAQQHGLAHHSVPATAAALDKAAQRAAFSAAKVAQPTFACLRADDDPAEVAALIGFPCVIKATRLAGGRGVLRADSPADARWAVARIRAILTRAGRDPAEGLLVEEFVDGHEVALEGLLAAGRLHVLALFDKPGQAQGPAFPETMLVTPSRLASADKLAVHACAAAAAAALGLVQGPLHAEFRLSAQGPKVLEVNPRSIGGLCGRTLRFDGGASLEEVVLAAALGRPAPLGRIPGGRGVYMLDVPCAGRFAGVHGVPAACAVPGIDDVVITMPTGSAVEPLPEGGEYLGFVFASAATPAAVEAALTAAVARLVVAIEPPQRLAGV